MEGAVTLCATAAHAVAFPAAAGSGHSTITPAARSFRNPRYDRLLGRPSFLPLIPLGPALQPGRDLLPQGAQLYRNTLSPLGEGGEPRSGETGEGSARG